MLSSMSHVHPHVYKASVCFHHNDGKYTGQLLRFHSHWTNNLQFCSGNTSYDKISDRLYRNLVPNMDFIGGNSSVSYGSLLIGREIWRLMIERRTAIETLTLLLSLHCSANGNYHVHSVKTILIAVLSKKFRWQSEFSLLRSSSIHPLNVSQCFL